MDLHESFTLPPKVMDTQALAAGIKWRSQLSRGDFRCDNLTMPGGGAPPFFPAASSATINLLHVIFQFAALIGGLARNPPAVAYTVQHFGVTHLACQRYWPPTCAQVRLAKDRFALHADSWKLLGNTECLIAHRRTPFAVTRINVITRSGVCLFRNLDLTSPKGATMIGADML